MASAQPQLPIKRKPTHRLFRVNGDGESANWIPIGAAWPHEDGKGFSVSCDEVPLSGRIVLRFIEAPAGRRGAAMTPSSSNSRPARIAELNDEFRRLGPNLSRTRFEGLWLVTSGVQSLGPQFTWSALVGTMNFDAFAPDNDPHGEHDFGEFTVQDQRVVWKIDYLQRGTAFGADDPSDHDATTRMITIMLAVDC